MLETTCDEMLYGRLRLLQPVNGQRVSMDTVLLSAWVKVRSRTREILEAGCASGAVSLLLAMKHERVRVTGVDIQPELVELATLNASNNGLSGRVSFIAGDIRDKSLFPREKFDIVAANPPYSSLNAGRESPDSSRTASRLEVSCTPDDVAEFSHRVLKSRGRLFTIFTSGRLDVFLSSMRAHRMTPKRIRPVYPAMNYNSGVFLSECVKDGGDGMSILPPLFVRDMGGNYTAEILRAYEPDGYI